MRERRNSSTSPDLLAAALFDVAAEHGLENASVREVAKKAGVSIGAVQHHFSTKDDMFAYALRALADRLLTGLTASAVEADPQSSLFHALAHLLPLDAQRTRDVHVLAAFSVRAATSDSLADIHRKMLFAIRTTLSSILIRLDVPEAETRAALLLSAVNGLAVDALGSSSLYPAQYLEHALRTQISLTLLDTETECAAVGLAS